MLQENGFHDLPNAFNATDRRMHITAGELNHLKGVQTFGFTVEEQTPPGTISVEKAEALGIKPGKKYSLLKCGISVMNDDESAIVQPQDVLTQTFRARKFTFLADHRFVPEPMMQLCVNSDVLIHEATLAMKDSDKMKIRGHNTAYNAGVAGRNFGCPVVVLNHFAGVSASEASNALEEIVEEAHIGNKGASQIVASYDFMELCVPRGGFKFNETNDENEEKEQVTIEADEDDSLLSKLTTSVT
jgi:ribonuclease Z